MTNTAKQLTLASEHMRAGNLPRASALYQRILRHQPKHAEAWHLLGIAVAGTGDAVRATAFMVKAIQLGGPVPEYCANLGRVLMRLNRYAEASSCFRQALAGDPLNPRISLELGTSLAAAGQLAAAVVALEYAADLAPSNVEIRFHLGNVLFQTGDLPRAARCYERVLKLRRDHAESRYNLGVVRMMERQFDSARTCFRRAIELKPGYAEAHHNLAVLAHAAGDYDAAARGYRLALRAKPGFTHGEYNFACLLQDCDDLERSRNAFRHLLKAHPDHADAHIRLGNVLRSLNQTAEAVPHYRSAVALRPASADAQFDLGLALLQIGEWTEGWPLHEWRLRQGAREPRAFDCPAWDGLPLENRHLLLHAEQGLGDTIQFSRYASLVHEQGGRITLECHAPLAGLMDTLDGVDQVVAFGDRLPACDVHASVMSLPAILGTTPDTVPCEVPYLLPDRELVDNWSDRLRRSVDPKLLRVGLAWAGNSAHKNDRNRSLGEGVLDGLAGLDGIAWFNLQKDTRGDVSPLPLQPMVEECSDFKDTAAAILCLDLVISVDTAVAHLAGALGKRVWTLLPFAADWRWMMDRTDTPWYPTMRLFRQRRRGDWAPVIATIRSELESEVQAR